MAPNRGTKRTFEDKVYASKPILRQKTFAPRLRTAKVVAKAEEDIERPRKRRKSQTTMTQLEFGKRSYLEVICDSDEDDKLDPEDLSSFSSPNSTNKKRTGRRSRLPRKTESQDTLTQFVKRSSGVSMLLVHDSEEDETGSEANLSDAAGELLEVETVAIKRKRIAEQNITEEKQKPVLNQDIGQLGVHTTQEEEKHVLMPSHAPVCNELRWSSIPKTPKRIRTLPVPSSRSPPDTNLSTQVTPRRVPRFAPTSPLQERAVNIPAVRAEHMASTKRLKASPLRNSSKFSPGTKENRPEPEESPTKRRVREFNARFAEVERRNSGIRNKRINGHGDLAATIQPLVAKVHSTDHYKMTAVETQYSMPGLETQTALLELPLVGTNDMPAVEDKQAQSSGIVECSQAMEEMDVQPDAPCVPTLTMIKEQGEKQGISEEDGAVPEEILPSKNDILIPSSPSRGKRHCIFSSQGDADEGPYLLEESLPESPYLPASARSRHSKKDTQELASDQLMRETQQAFMYRVPASQGAMPASSRCPSRLQSSALSSSENKATVRASQASTVDETMTYSSLLAQQERLATRTSMKGPKAFEVIYSSPILEPMVNLPPPSSSSPLQQPPDLSDTAASSSSPRCPGPKTPQHLRNLKRPLRMEELVSDSLEESCTMPPTWRTGIDFQGIEDSDDGEL